MQVTDQHTQCDEARPNCGNCAKRGTECSFQIFDPVPQIKSSITRQGISSPLIHVFSLDQAAGTNIALSDGLLSPVMQSELRQQVPEKYQIDFEHVLAHFATKTIPTLSPGSAAQNAWHKGLPIFALQHPFVLHGILALGCLHLSTLASTPEEKDRYQTRAATQMNTGLEQYRSEILNIRISNAEALLSFSTLFTTFTNYLSHTECKKALDTVQRGYQDTGPPEELISTLVNSVCNTFRCIRGVLVILVPCWHHLKSGLLQPIVERDWWPSPVVMTPEETVLDQKLRHLETMWSNPDRMYEYSHDTLRAALKSLREAFALNSRLADYAVPGDASEPKMFDWTSIFDWPVSLSLDFISQLEQRRMEPWVIVAHFAVLPSTIEGPFWIDGMGQNILSAAAIVIGEDNWHWIEWPASTIGVNLQTLLHANIVL